MTTTELLLVWICNEQINIQINQIKNKEGL